MDLKTNSSILERREVAEKTPEVSFKRPADYQFEAGQYAQVIIPELLYPDQRGSSRVFSIVSSPTDNSRITIAFRDSGSGYKRTLIEAPLGYDIVIRGPFGSNFTLPEDRVVNVVFIAGGIGITPFLSMSSLATEKKLSLPITLLYANRNEKSAAYLKEIGDIVSRNPNFTVKNKFGKVDENFIRKNVKDVLTCEWYIAGPPAMVEHSKSIILSLGVGLDRIHTERFTGY
jgi:ferredoxin-NADP reductase